MHCLDLALFAKLLAKRPSDGAYIPKSDTDAASRKVRSRACLSAVVKFSRMERFIVLRAHADGPKTWHGRSLRGFFTWAVFRVRMGTEPLLPRVLLHSAGAGLHIVPLELQERRVRSHMYSTHTRTHTLCLSDHSRPVPFTEV